MSSFDRPRHGWEGNSRGGEIYGNSGRNNGGFNSEKAYLQAVSDALKMSMSGDPAISSKAMGHLRAAQRRYGHLIDDDSSKIQGDGSEISQLLSSMSFDDEVEFRTRSK